MVLQLFAYIFKVIFYWELVFAWITKKFTYEEWIPNPPCQPTGFFTFFPSMVLQLFAYILKVIFYWEISVCLNLSICPCSKLYGESQSFLPLNFGIQGKTAVPFPTQVSYWKIYFFIVGKLSPLEKLLEHREVGTTFLKRNQNCILKQV